MALFEDGSKEIHHHFPTLPAFLCPVEVKEAEQYGEGHMGVYALADIPAGTKFWVWTDRVEMIHHEELEEYIARNVVVGEKKRKDDEEEDNNSGGVDVDVDVDAIRRFLRQGFVLPPSEKEGTGRKVDDYFYSNPTDAGRFMNHSNDPNCGPDGTLRDIRAGEEMTMDYSFHGDPQWYRNICQKYGVLTEAQIAKQARGER